MDQGDDTLTKGRELVKKARGHLDDLLSMSCLRAHAAGLSIFGKRGK
jgi:hypothetical protein